MTTPTTAPSAYTLVARCSHTSVWRDAKNAAHINAALGAENVSAVHLYPEEASCRDERNVACGVRE